MIAPLLSMSRSEVSFAGLVIYEYIGCYIDGWAPNQDLPVHIIDDMNDLTIEKCITQCQTHVSLKSQDV